MKQRTVYVELYRGIHIEVTNSSMPGFKDDCWCAYIHLASDRHPEILNFEVDYETSCYTDLVPFFDQFSFHGGITFSEVTKHRDVTRMKIGCDYLHYGDKDGDHSLHSVMSDMKKVVDQYRELFPEVTNATME